MTLSDLVGQLRSSNASIRITAEEAFIDADTFADAVKGDKDSTVELLFDLLGQVQNVKAARLLCDIVPSNEKQRVVDAGYVRLLVEGLSHVEDPRGVLKALTRFASNNKMRDEVKKAGEDSLVALLGRGEANAAEAAALLLNLSVVVPCASIRPLLEVAEGGSEDALSLLRLAADDEDDDFATAMVKEEAIPRLVKLLRADAYVVRTSSAKLLESLAAGNPDNLKAIDDAGAIPPLVELMCNYGSFTAATAIRMLSKTPLLAVILRGDASVNTLLDAFKRKTVGQGTEQPSHRAAVGSPIEEREDAVRHLQDFLRTGDWDKISYLTVCSDTFPRLVELVRGDDEDSQKRAFELLFYFASNAEEYGIGEMLVESDAIPLVMPPLFELLGEASEDDEKGKALVALACLSTNDSALETIKKAGAIPALAELWGVDESHPTNQEGIGRLMGPHLKALCALVGASPWGNKAAMVARIGRTLKSAVAEAAAAAAEVVAAKAAEAAALEEKEADEVSLSVAAEGGAATVPAEYEVERILKKRRRKGVDEFLVKWMGYDKEGDNTWEPLEHVKDTVQYVEWCEAIEAKERAAAEATAAAKAAANARAAAEAAAAALEEEEGQVHAEMGAAEADGDEGCGEEATEDEPPKLDLSWLERLPPRHLKPICEKKGLATSGNSQALAERLRADGDLSLTQLAALCGVVGIKCYGTKAAIARRIGTKLSSTVLLAGEGSDAKTEEANKRPRSSGGHAGPARSRCRADEKSTVVGDGSQQIKATLPPPAPPPYDEELDRRQAAAGEAEGEAVRANSASVVGAQQLLQQIAIMREMMANMEAAAAGHVAEAEAAASASAEAIAARKEIENLYADKEAAILAENSKLEAKLREVEGEPARGPGSKAKNEAMEKRKAARKEIEESQCMTRATYAKHLRSLLGKNAIDGQDVFHIIANSKGGADHPDNFLYALGQTFNRSIGDGYDHFNAFLAGREKTLKAIKVSRKYGNRKDPRGKAVKLYKPQRSQEDEVEADWLFAKGQKLMTAVRAAERAAARQ